MRIALLATLLMLVSCKGKSSEDKPPAGSGGGSAAPVGDTSPKFAACTFISVQEAGALFGQPATQVQGPTTSLHGECDWTYEAPDHSSYLLQLNIWTEDFYKQGGEHVDEDAQPFEIGERKGNIKVADLTGVDIEWVQGGRFIQFSYFTTGPSVPKAPTKVEEVKALAKKVSAKL